MNAETQARRIAKGTRTRRPTRIVTCADGTSFAQQYGRRAGLHESHSQTAYARAKMNRRDRREARATLRRDPEAVELRQARARSIWTTR